MRPKRSLVLLALGGAAGFVLGRYPAETFAKVRSVTGTGVGLARERVGPRIAAKSPLGRTGGHRAAADQPPGSGEFINGTSPYAARPRP